MLYLTIDFLDSFGFIHLIKNGLQLLSVFINSSRESLNCEANVYPRF